MNIYEQIKENVDIELLTIDGFDNAVIGIDIHSMRLIYSRSKIIQILMEDDMEEIDAIEYFDYNILSTYIDENTPIICIDSYSTL